MRQARRAAASEDLAFQAQAGFVKAMGHAARLRILHRLHVRQGPVPAGELLKALRLSRPALSQHLAKMASVGLVRTWREGRSLQVELLHPDIGKACEIVRRALARALRTQVRAFED